MTTVSTGKSSTAHTVNMVKYLQKRTWQNIVQNTTSQKRSHDKFLLLNPGLEKKLRDNTSYQSTEDILSYSTSEAVGMAMSVHHFGSG